MKTLSLIRTGLLATLCFIVTLVCKFFLSLNLTPVIASLLAFTGLVAAIAGVCLTLITILLLLKVELYCD